MAVYECGAIDHGRVTAFESEFGPQLTTICVGRIAERGARAVK